MMTLASVEVHKIYAQYIMTKKCSYSLTVALPSVVWWSMTTLQYERFSLYKNSSLYNKSSAVAEMGNR